MNGHRLGLPKKLPLVTVREIVCRHVPYGETFVTLDMVLQTLGLTQ